MPATTVINHVQRQAGGRMVDFHGWEMAVQFQGITQEHVAVRTAAGIFDVCHMGRLHLSGRGALAFLSQRVCRRLADQKAGVVRYGLVLAEDGTVEDDILVSREGEDAFHIVVNSSNKDKILGLWRPALPAGLRLDDRSESEGMVAVQGPQALAILAGLDLDGRALGNYRFLDAAWQGAPVRLSRTGYTGEDGLEIFCPRDATPSLWQAIVAAGVAPCGLGCRDTLRTEAGMPLYGNDLDRGTTPVEAGLGWAVDPLGSFIGHAVCQRQLREGTARRLVGLRMREKRVPRHGYAVLRAGVPVGAVSSGTLSPTLGQAIGMAYVASDAAALGGSLAVDIRGTAVEAEVVALPFYKRAKA